MYIYAHLYVHIHMNACTYMYTHIYEHKITRLHASTELHTNFGPVAPWGPRSERAPNEQPGFPQGLLFGLFKGGFKVSSGTEWYTRSFGTDFDTSEVAGSVSWLSWATYGKLK